MKRVLAIAILMLGYLLPAPASSADYGYGPWGGAPESIYRIAYAGSETYLKVQVGWSDTLDVPLYVTWWRADEPAYELRMRYDRATRASLDDPGFFLWYWIPEFEPVVYLNDATGTLLSTDPAGARYAVVDGELVDEVWTFDTAGNVVEVRGVLEGQPVLVERITSAPAPAPASGTSAAPAAVGAAGASTGTWSPCYQNPDGEVSDRRSNQPLYSNGGRRFQCNVAEHLARTACNTHSTAERRIRTDYRLGTYTAISTGTETFRLEGRLGGYAAWFYAFRLPIGASFANAKGIIDFFLVDSGGSVLASSSKDISPPKESGGLQEGVGDTVWVDEPFVLTGTWSVRQGSTYTVMARLTTTALADCAGAAAAATAEWVERGASDTFFAMAIDRASGTLTPADCQAGGDAGNSFASATPLATPMGDCSGLLRPGDEDWYSFSYPGNTLWFRVQDPNASLCFTFYSPSNTPVNHPSAVSGCEPEGRMSGGWTWNYDPGASGTYRLRVRASTILVAPVDYTIALDPK